jgi:hypothetical protein
LLEQLRDWGVAISSGQLERILTEDKDAWHDEKDALLAAGTGTGERMKCCLWQSRSRPS